MENKNNKAESSLTCVSVSPGTAEPGIGFAEPPKAEI
jgi:hypothetical protein